MKSAIEKVAAEFGVRIELHEQVASTNDTAAEERFCEGDAVIALEQTLGRGQRGNTWSSEKGKNLTFSMVFEPDFLPAERQFLISQAVSLAIADSLYRRDVDALIKWPNDIYSGNRKIAGILIENTISGSELQRSVVGIGLNVNQIDFHPSLPNPTSLALETGVETDIFELFGELYRCLLARYAFLIEHDYERIEEDYRNGLYLLDTPHTFEVDGHHIQGTIRGTGEYGQLMVEHPAPEGIRYYQFKEIVF